MPIEKWSDRVVIVHLSSDHHLADDLQAVQDEHAQQPVDAVLDFAAVKYVNSSHIARLLKLRKMINSSDNRMVLCALDTQVWGAFLVTGLDKIFEFTDSVPTALASLQLSRQS